MKLYLEIDNKTKFSIKNINFKKITDKFEIKLMKILSTDINIDIGIHFVNKILIKKINKKFRLMEKPTDVLSFPIYNDFSKVIKTDLKQINLGDIFICPDIAKTNISNSNKKLDNEIIFLINHGINHLLGIHHD